MAGIPQTAENVLGFADAPTTELDARVVEAARYATAWKDEGHKGQLTAKIEGMIRRLADMRGVLKKNAPFLGKKGKESYDKLSADWADLYRDAAFATDTKALNSQSSLEDALDALERGAKVAGKILLIAVGAYFALKLITAASETRKALAASKG